MNSEDKNKKENLVVEREKKVSDFWQKEKIFEKTLSKKSPKGNYIFYDGPPFATGTPHYGHLLAGAMKDTIPRYQTMRGYRVARRWGWDCHGLPIENLIQKELNLKTREDIERIGIKKFNDSARASVFKYDLEWKKIVPRTGRWVDMEDQYTTMDSTFMESVWWSFKELYKKNLVYEGFKSVHLSPELETPLSNFEVGLGYKDIEDLSVFILFPLKDGSEMNLVAWTTTPWTLPGNVALAVSENIEYGIYQNQSGKKIVLSKKLASKVFELLAEDKWLEIDTIKGQELVGKEYEPLFDYYSNDQKIINYQNGWKIYSADFVSTEEGTGIVHIAPAFGEDDYELSLKKNLPFIQHVKTDGKIKDEVIEFAGLSAKPKSNPTETDEKIAELLNERGKLLVKQKIVHSYPHCWRTDAPLLNYALSSWFVKSSDLRDQLVKNNQKIHWVPESVGKNRFGNWLEGIKDWSVSRSRYWGTPIPIWKSEDGKEIEFIGSIAELKEKTKSSNNFIFLRHGQAEHNVNDTLSADDTVLSRLTEEGIESIKKSAHKLKEKNISAIYSSPLHRSFETSKIISEIIGFPVEKIKIDDRLKEIQSGILNGHPTDEMRKLFKSQIEKFSLRPEGGENLTDIRKRVGDFVFEIDQKHKDEKILIVTHEYPIWMAFSIANGLNNKQSALLKEFKKSYLPTGEFIELNFSKLPFNESYEIDLHRPNIDEISFEKNGKIMKRIPEVFDTWYDSGSMPYAEVHYPFENKEDFFKKRFPANFIAEGLDQTRGWFYTLLALNTALFGKAPYQNVIVNGLVLAEDGRKMSKSLKNYPDPWHILDTYGADSLRLYMFASPIVEAEDLNFSEKGVDEVMKKNISRLYNVLSFLEMYSVLGEEIKPKTNLKNILDLWIVYRLRKLIKEVTKTMENYELNRSVVPLFDFIDDLSTWYLRRSRERFKQENSSVAKEAVSTLSFVLVEFSKVMAPFAPFSAEYLFQKVSGFNFQKSEESVHLEDWPKEEKFEEKILESMKDLREMISAGLEQRNSAKIKVRQPLSELRQGYANFNDELLALAKDELNVKNIFYQSDLNRQVVLKTEIDQELKEEGDVREFLRFVQECRKEMNLIPQNSIVLKISENVYLKSILEKFSDFVKKTANISEFVFEDISEGFSYQDKEIQAKVFIQKNNGSSSL